MTNHPFGPYLLADRPTKKHKFFHNYRSPLMITRDVMERIKDDLELEDVKAKEVRLVHSGGWVDVWILPKKQR